ncbi:hypothetical protein [Obesumbacterium proteus]|uniref:hypothetical protein n=1 Tax=Obesumbacterium proteus TaxID=82983 RepID=UPI0024325B8D|nr:hypothetical protein [Obesumbacterium proteus]
MTQDEVTILMLKGLIASLPEEMQQNVQTCRESLQELLSHYPDGEAVIALGLTVAEIPKS